MSDERFAYYLVFETEVATFVAEVPFASEDGIKSVRLERFLESEANELAEGDVWEAEVKR